MAAVAHEHVRLAQSLPRQLLHFFKRFPPPQLSPGAPPPRPQTVQVVSDTSSSNPNAGGATIEVPADDPSPTPLIQNAKWKRNPFLAHKNPTTGNWHAPHYSLRRQADLFRLAVEYNVLPLMPESPKHPEIKAAKRVEQGLRVKGTGEGQRVKGKYWERTLKSRLEVRRKAMEAMPDMIRTWKETGHGRGWKKYPRGRTLPDNRRKGRGVLEYA
ncbi:hypothetical protein BAUCODRAFT_127191 [Baudoinia panamericana UAMH 10762]|uniref:Large ribosomal subunit protein mL59 domain-containing protein n=1 Tax=Baudoinia panamericana (strain UAMH 10762) TaxID=717646 RepID=M2MYB4_BAUPA|nr:uncharacterized protein BAUCODRAFT_127191 [Baudoinia panamericana UAMH 10762]EMC91280.1 hypothetical protein BAUCODRAFT_127191 [Baudoinia panamericana UAMH 10762]